MGVQELIALARPLLTPSEDISNVTGFRVSESTWIPREEERKEPLRSLLLRMHNVLGLPPDHGEKLQVVRYGRGGRYNLHPDSVPSKGAPRTHTLLAYLSTPSAGGDTIFPHVASPPGMDGGALRTEAPSGFRSHRDDEKLRADFAELCEQGGAHEMLRVAPKKGDALLFMPMHPWMEIDARVRAHGRSLRGCDTVRWDFVGVMSDSSVIVSSLCEAVARS